MCSIWLLEACVYVCGGGGIRDMVALSPGVSSIQCIHSGYICAKNLILSECNCRYNYYDCWCNIGGQQVSVNFWDPHKTSAPSSSSFADESTLYSNPAYFEYEYPEFESHQASGHADNRPSLHYEVASIMNPMGQYEIMDGQNHYEVASNLELPAFPYERPTPNVRTIQKLLIVLQCNY